MSTKIRPEISKSKKDYVSRERYYELKHFCLQYDEWKNQYEKLSELMLKGINYAENVTFSGDIADFTGDVAVKLAELSDKIKLVEDAVKEASGDMYDYMMLTVTKEYSYVYLSAFKNIPICKESFYKLYRKCFRLLDERRA